MSGRARRRRRPRVHWVDTHVDLAPLYLPQWQIPSDQAGQEALFAAKLIVNRAPSDVEAVSSILEGKDEGFRCRRIVGQLRLETPELSENEAFDAFSVSIWVGIAVLKMRDNGTPEVGQAGNWVMAPWEQRDNSESWMFRRTYSWRCTTQAALNGLGVRDNTFMVPFGDFIDVTVNRRVANDEDIVLLAGWTTEFSPITGISYTFPRIQRNLRMLISR